MESSRVTELATRQKVQRLGREGCYNSAAMEKTIQFFKSFAEAEEADKKYYQSLTPTQRIEILLILRSQFQPHDHESRGRLKRVYRIIKRS